MLEAKAKTQTLTSSFHKSTALLHRFHTLKSVLFIKLLRNAFKKIVQLRNISSTLMYLFIYLSHTEDEVIKFLRSFYTYLPNYTTSWGQMTSGPLFEPSQNEAGMQTLYCDFCLLSREEDTEIPR
jgi:hypothetical protein